jgi:hypothetical protein
LLLLPVHELHLTLAAICTAYRLQLLGWLLPSTTRAELLPPAYSRSSSSRLVLRLLHIALCTCVQACTSSMIADSAAHRQVVGQAGLQASAGSAHRQVVGQAGLQSCTCAGRQAVASATRGATPPFTIHHVHAYLTNISKNAFCNQSSS